MRQNYRVPHVDADKCQLCQRCPVRAQCKTKALVQFEAYELPYIDRDLCRACLTCLEACPFRAIVVE